MEMIIALGILSFFFLALAFLLDDKHTVIKVFSLFLSILFIVLLSSHINVKTENYYCDIVKQNETINGNTTTFNYNRVCYPYEQNTGFSAFKLVQYFIRYLPLYVFLFLLYYGATVLGLDLLEKVKELFKK